MDSIWRRQYSSNKMLPVESGSEIAEILRTVGSILHSFVKTLASGGFSLTLVLVNVIFDAH